MDWANAVQQIHTLLSQLPGPGPDMITIPDPRHHRHRQPQSPGPGRQLGPRNHPGPCSSPAGSPRRQRHRPGTQQRSRHGSWPHQVRRRLGQKRAASGPNNQIRRRIAYAAEDRRRRTIGRISCDGRGAAVVTERDPERRPAEFLIADSPSSLSLPNRRDLLGLSTGPARRRSAAPRRRGDRLDAKHVKRLRRLPSRHFGDTANSDVTVAFSGTAVTVLMALAPEGE